MKKYYDVKIEALVPCTVVYRVQAENEADAILEMERNTSIKTPSNVKHRIPKMIKQKVIVSDAGCSNILATKSY
jgi:hypothetical protein